MQRHRAQAVAPVVLLLAIGFVGADEAEDRAIAVIKKLGGAFKRDEKKVDKPAVEVSLNGTPVNDAGLRDLAALTQLRALDLTGTNVTDKGLKQLAALTQLQTLDLAQTKVTDVGLRELEIGRAHV